MPTQQIVVPPSRAAMFMVLTVNEGSEEQIRALLSNLSSLARAVGFRDPTDHMDCIAGIGADLWDRMFPDLPRPAQLHPLAPINGPKHVAPSTPGDLLLHLRSKHLDLCFELARQVVRSVQGHVEVVDETHGFKYFDERDLLGFVDGSQNPEGSAATTAAVIGEEDAAYAGGSYVIVQKYVHDLTTWEALTVEQQERVIGRTKLDDIQFSDAQMPSDAHVQLNTIIDPDGVQKQILRGNMPFGDVGTGEFGTYYIAYAADPTVTEHMLHNMYIGDPPGNTDRILDFSTPLTGCLFLVPTVEFLDNITVGTPIATASSAIPG